MFYLQVILIGFIVTFMNVTVLLAAIEHQKFINIECTISGKGTVANPSCSISSGSLNLDMNVPKELNKFHLNITTLYYKKQNSHPIQIVKLSPFDYCKSIKKTISNPMLKLMLNFFNETQPGLVHDCPYMGLLQVSNFRLNQNQVTFIPSGYYRTIFHAYNGDDDNIITLNCFSCVQC